MSAEAPVTNRTNCPRCVAGEVGRHPDSGGTHVYGMPRDQWDSYGLCTCDNQLQPHDRMEVCEPRPDKPEWLRRVADRPPLGDHWRRRHHCTDVVLGESNNG